MAITETRSLPPQFVEDLGKDYATQLTGLTSQKLDTTQFQPMVAGQDQATKDAYTQATTQGQGIGAYAPYLTAAGQYQTGTGTYGGIPTNMMGAQDLTGPDAYKSFMSPYQQDVIDATMSEYDKQAQAGITGIGQQAAMSGNLGGGREGVMRSEYQSQQDLNRALLNAKMLQQGFTQAQTAANQAFGQQRNLAQDISGLGGLQYKLQGQDVSRLGSAGAIQQAQAQAEANALQEANRLKAYEPYERLGYLGSGLSSMLAGMPGGYQTSVTPNKSPLEQALGILSTGVGAYKAFSDN